MTDGTESSSFSGSPEAKGQRDAFLDEACGAEAELRREVESLLKHHHEASTGFMEPGQAEADTERHYPKPLMPKKIGHYAIKSHIGSGGMAHVYLAVQEHPHLAGAPDCRSSTATGFSATERSANSKIHKTQTMSFTGWPEGARHLTSRPAFAERHAARQPKSVTSPHHCPFLMFFLNYLDRNSRRSFESTKPS